MPDFLAYLNMTLCVGLVAFALGVVFSQRIKDLIHGVPADLRAGLNSLEAKVRASAKHQTSLVIEKVHTAVPEVPAPAATLPAPSG